MDRAFNKRTEEIVDAFEVFTNGLYQNIDSSEWCIPRDSIISECISNWDSEEMKDKKEEPVYYKKEHVRVLKNGKEKLWRPHFAKYPNSVAETVAESPEHKMIKDWLAEKLKKDDLEIRYSRATKKYSYNNSEKISDLGIAWNNYSVEVPIRGIKNLKADIILPFKKRHFHLGYGVVIEIQLSPQVDEKTKERVIDRAIMGYSTVFLFKKDFKEIDLVENVIELKKQQLDVESYQSQLKFNGRNFFINLKNVTQEQIYYLNKERKELDDKMEENREVVENSLSEIEEEKVKCLSNMKRESERYITLRLKELGGNFQQEMIELVQKDFFENNIAQVKQVLNEILPSVIKRELNLYEMKEEIRRSLVENFPFSDLTKQVTKELVRAKTFIELMNNPPICCGSPAKLICKKDLSYAYVCERCNKWFNIPKSINDIVNRGEVNG
jgi:hypothetical protein